MNALLDQVLTANGGVDRWNDITSITAEVTFGGPFWEFKGQPGFAGTELVEASARREFIRQTDVKTGRTVVFDKAKDLVTVTDADGAVIDELEHPRHTFDGYTTSSTWSIAQMAYFRSYATWHYLVEPFVFAFPGVTTREIAARVEDGETWRGLSVTFAGDLETHNRTQFYYFNDAGRLRRMDYQPEVNDFSPTAHYVREETEVDGVTVPTKRHVHIRNQDRSADLSWIPITLDLTDIRFH